MLGRPVKSMLVPWLGYVPTPRHRAAPEEPVTKRSIVFDYIKAHPGLTVYEIAKATGQPIQNVGNTCSIGKSNGLLYSEPVHSSAPGRGSITVQAYFFKRVH
jgi:hypothetical protein